MALTIAGSDSGGGAGIQADLRTFAAFGVHGASAITAITAQNTVGVDGIWPVAVDGVKQQIISVLDDMPICALKTGMLYSSPIVDSVLSALNRCEIPLVVDPVALASSGETLSESNRSLINQKSYWQLLTRATLVTPNLDEAAALLEINPAHSLDEMHQQGQALLAAGLSAVLLKGGHLVDKTCTDILLWRNGQQLFEQTFHAPRIISNNIHGTGCTLSAAITAGLALKLSLVDAVARAKDYLTTAIEQGKDKQFGKGSGPVQHF